MNGRSSTTARLESDDASTEDDYRERILRAADELFHAQDSLRHRETHETQEALKSICAALEALGVEEVPEEIGSGISGG